MTRVDSPVPLMHDDPDRSWITNPDPDHPKGTHPYTTDRCQLPELYEPVNKPTRKRGIDILQANKSCHIGTHLHRIRTYHGFRRHLDA